MSSLSINVGQIQNETIAQTTDRYYLHFLYSYLEAVNNVSNYSSNDTWTEIFILWDFLKYIASVKSFSEEIDIDKLNCMLGKYPLSKNFSSYNKSDSGENVIDNETDNIPLENLPQFLLQNLFQSITNGVDTIVAQSPTEPLTFVGVGITITIDAATNTITWTVTDEGGSGNYDTLLDGTIEVPETIGGFNSGTTVDDVRGLPLIEMWDQLLFPAIPPTYVSPTASLVGSNPKLVSVGVSLDITLQAAFNQNDAGAFSAYALTKVGSQIASTENHVDSNVVLNSPGSVSYFGTYTFADGPIKNDSYGNPFPTGQILGGNLFTNNQIYQWIYPWFWGIAASPIGIDPATGNEVVANINGSISITFNSTSNDYLWFAVPAGEPAFTAWEENLTNFGSIGTPSDLFGASSIVAVTTVNFAGIDYDLYVSNYSTQFTTPITITQ